MSASSTYKSFLMYKATSGASTYTKLVDIKDYPDLGGAPEQLETTTLSDGMQTFCEGIRTNGVLEFTCNYNSTDYATLTGLAGSEKDFSVWFGATVSNGVATPTGTDGKFNFKGYLTVTISGKGANEVREMVASITPTTAITSGS